VMLAQADEVEPELVGQHRLLDHVAQHLVHGLGLAVGAEGHVAEGVEAKGDGRRDGHEDASGCQAAPPSWSRAGRHERAGPHRRCAGPRGLRRGVRRRASLHGRGQERRDARMVARRLACSAASVDTLRKDSP
jgi:hypothetical protein